MLRRSSNKLPLPCKAYRACWVANTLHKRTNRVLSRNRNEACVFVTDPIFLPKMLIPDPITMSILIPEPVFVVTLIPDSMKNIADPDPMRCDSKSRGCDS